MPTINDILNSLPEKERRILMYSLEHDMSNIVEYETGKFIGVNVKDSKRNQVLSEAGKWSTGIIKK